MFRRGGFGVSQGLLAPQVCGGFRVSPGKCPHGACALGHGLCDLLSALWVHCGEMITGCFILN